MKNNSLAKILGQVSRENDIANDRKIQEIHHQEVVFSHASLIYLKSFPEYQAYTNKWNEKKNAYPSLFTPPTHDGLHHTAFKIHKEVIWCKINFPTIIQSGPYSAGEKCVRSLGVFTQPASIGLSSFQDPALIHPGLSYNMYSSSWTDPGDVLVFVCHLLKWR